jgi:LPS-assembly protein
LRCPYFWELAPNYDITFRPLLTTHQGPLLRAEWRHRLARGVYSVDAGGIHQLDRDVRPPGDRRWRGFARTRGDFNINENWTWGWDATAVSDDTFMRRYRIDNRTEIVSQAHLTGLSGRNYFTAQTLHFQGLLRGDASETFPYVLPYMRHDYIFDRPVLGGEFGIDTNVYSLMRDDPWMPFPTVQQARRQSRAVVDAHWQRRMVGAMGQVITPFARLRGDVYVTEDLPEVTDPARRRDEEITARMLPTAGVDLRWPFMRSDGLGTHVVTPVAQIISSANEVRRDRIGNEDAIQVNFDHTGLFLHDRFMGEDRFEGGTRANLGLLYTMLLPTGGFARASLASPSTLPARTALPPNQGSPAPVLTWWGPWHCSLSRICGSATRCASMRRPSTSTLRRSGSMPTSGACHDAELCRNRGGAGAWAAVRPGADLGCGGIRAGRRVERPWSGTL